MNPFKDWTYLGKCNHSPKVAWDNLPPNSHDCHSWNISLILLSSPLVLYPTSFSYRCEALAYLGPIYVCFGLCFHYFRQHDVSKWPYFQFHLRGMKGHCFLCTPPPSSNRGKCLGCLSYDKHFFAPQGFELRKKINFSMYSSFKGTIINIQLKSWT